MTRTTFFDFGELRHLLPPSLVLPVPQSAHADDTLVVEAPARRIATGFGDDEVFLTADARVVRLGPGDDRLEIDGGSVERAHGGAGDDVLAFERDLGDFDLEVNGRRLTLADRFTGETTFATSFETVVLAGTTYDLAELRESFGRGADAPAILVSEGTQAVTVNNPDPTVSVVWDRAVQAAVIETETPIGPTIAARAYAMLHTAMYDAWATYDPVAVRVSFDGADGDNDHLAARAADADADATKAMSFAAHTVLAELFPDQTSLFDRIMAQRYGYAVTGDDGLAAQIGRDAAEDLLALRRDDGANQDAGYEAGDDYYAPVNLNPDEIDDISRWTPEYVPIDNDDPSTLQSFLTPQWQDVEGFALPADESGATVFDTLRPPAPPPFFTEDFANSVLNDDTKTITLSAPLCLAGEHFDRGQEIAVSQDLIGSVINEAFIEQARDIIDISAGLTDREKIIAEFWEDGAGTAFPPGTFMSFAQYVSARDDHGIDDDAKLFLAMGNAALDAGIATWEAKVFYDYVRPVRAIRDLGELGLIGEWGTDSVTAEEGWVVEAFAGFDPLTGEGLGTRTILAENFVTFQRPSGDPSPPFAEYTSGHSGFSAAGATVLELFTGSEAFGGSVTFAPGATQFETGVPAEETTLAWETFGEAADEAGLSRLFGGIHFEQGDEVGRELGRALGEAAYATAQSFFEGTATDADRPFFADADLWG